jgi:hypothetical protein
MRPWRLQYIERKGSMEMSLESSPANSKKHLEFLPSSNIIHTRFYTRVFSHSFVKHPYACCIWAGFAGRNAIWILAQLCFWCMIFRQKLHTVFLHLDPFILVYFKHTTRNLILRLKQGLNKIWKFFVLNYFYYIFKFFWCGDVKNNFLKIKKILF